MSDLLYEVKDKIATITLNRPDKLNAFTRDMIDAWAKALSAAQADESVNVIIVTGSGRAFCSGGDVGRMREGEPTALDGKNSLWEGVHRVPKTLETVDKPVIAMVNGLARQIADGPQIPIRMIKRLVYQSLRLDLRTHLDLVSSHMSIVRQTADHKEGVAAFKEKRPPRFEGR